MSLCLVNKSSPPDCYGNGFGWLNGQNVGHFEIFFILGRMMHACVEEKGLRYAKSHVDWRKNGEPWKYVQHLQKCKQNNNWVVCQQELKIGGWLIAAQKPSKDGLPRAIIKRVIAGVWTTGGRRCQRAARDAPYYLIVFQWTVDEQCGLLLHPLHDGVSHTVVGLGAGLPGGLAVLIVHILLDRPGWAESHTVHCELWGTKAMSVIITQLQTDFSNWSGIERERCRNIQGHLLGQ